MWRLKGTLLVCFLSTLPLDHVEAITAPLKHPGTGSLDPPRHHLLHLCFQSSKMNDIKK